MGAWSFDKAWREVNGKVLMTSNMRGQYAALALTVLSAVATAVASSPFASARTPKRHHSSEHPATATQPPARVACTVLGCQPIPAACTPVPVRTWSGLPTGYDVIVCPPGIWPLR
jgi:hypothetical protein